MTVTIHMPRGRLQKPGTLELTYALWEARDEGGRQVAFYDADHPYTSFVAGEPWPYHGYQKWRREVLRRCGGIDQAGGDTSAAGDRSPSPAVRMVPGRISDLVPGDRIVREDIGTVRVTRVVPEPTGRAVVHFVRDDGTPDTLPTWMSTHARYYRLAATL